jgi:hypothetical protein
MSRSGLFTTRQSGNVEPFRRLGANVVDEAASPGRTTNRHIQGVNDGM